MSKLNRKGATILEALIAFVILSLVFATSLTIIVNAKQHTLITQERINAVSIAGIVRDKIESDYKYDDLASLVSGSDLTVTNSTCLESGLIGVCEVFGESIGDTNYQDRISLVFLQSNTTSETYQIIHFNVEVIYMEDLKVTIEGVIYE